MKLLVNFEKYHVFDDANIHTAILLADKVPKTNSVIFESYNSLRVAIDAREVHHVTQFTVIGTRYVSS